MVRGEAANINLTVFWKWPYRGLNLQSASLGESMLASTPPMRLPTNWYFTFFFIFNINQNMYVKLRWTVLQNVFNLLQRKGWIMLNNNGDFEKETPFKTPFTNMNIFPILSRNRISPCFQIFEWIRAYNLLIFLIYILMM